MTDNPTPNDIALLREAANNLLPFTSHGIGCAIYQRSWAMGEPPCTCGLDRARAALAPTQHDNATAEGEAVAWCSPGQLANLTEVDADGGVYLPIRKTKRGNFTMALYAKPAPSEQARAEGEQTTKLVAIRNELAAIDYELAQPHEWGYPDPVDGGFVSDSGPFVAGQMIGLIAARISAMLAASPSSDDAEGRV